jgi:outer membrane lipoprotein-sorting protein
MRQTTITNGSIMTMISPDTGQKFTQDLSKGVGPSTGSGRGMDSTKALDYFDLTVTEHGTTEYIITGKPKEANQFLGKMDFMIDAERYLPLRIAMYNPKGMLISLSEIEYQSFESTGEAVVWVPVKIKSVVTMQMGSVNSEMVYENIKVNQGIKDSVFEE